MANNLLKTTGKGCLIFIAFVIFMSIMAVIFVDQKAIDEINVKSTVEEKRIKDSITAIEQIKKNKFNKSKAGKIQKKHPNWSDEDCIKIAKRQIWIGMHYDMLVYMRGQPNSVNPSDYGSGPQYQYCWTELSPSCFYTKSDNIITSYN